jgi:hypothetical protein
MATSIFCSNAREFRDGRAEASQRVATRMALAEILTRVIPPLVTVYEDFEADLLLSEANDAALDLLDELERRGYTIVRRAAQ